MTPSMFSISDLETPVLILDTGIMHRNLDRMARIARENGVDLRPHVKTHKCPDLAREQLRSGAIGIAVAKLSEAEVMVRSGIENIQIANEIVDPRKIERLALLAKEAEEDTKPQVTIAADNPDNVDHLSSVMSRHGASLNVLVDIDIGYHRTGLPWKKPDMIARFVRHIRSAPGLHFLGIMTHAGQVYSSTNIHDVEEIGIHEGTSMAGLARQLANRGLECECVSVGSTSTAPFAAQVEGITEIRPGNYIFNDAIQMSLGVARVEDCALRILATVTSTPSKEWIIIDAGSKSLGPETGFAGNRNLTGHGHILGKDAVIDKLTEEHGFIGGIGTGETFELGEVIEIIPNHACFCVNLHDRMIGKQDGKEYRIEARGCVR